MADYIDRQALVEKLATLATRYSALGRVKVAQDYYWAITVLEGEPTADVAPVVHCKDCQSWKRNVGITDSQNGHCFEHDIDTNGQDFCSYGEPRKGE